MDIAGQLSMHVHFVHYSRIHDRVLATLIALTPQQQPVLANIL